MRGHYAHVETYAKVHIVAWHNLDVGSWQVRVSLRLLELGSESPCKSRSTLMCVCVSVCLCVCVYVYDDEDDK